jgi:hypothetical protein
MPGIDVSARTLTSFGIVAPDKKRNKKTAIPEVNKRLVLQAALSSLDVVSAPKK